MALPLPSSLSPSKVASFKDCALAFRFSAIDRLPEPPTVPAVKGTTVHRALELLLADEPEARTPERAQGCLDEALTEMADHPDYVALALDADAAEAFAAHAACMVERYFQLEDPRRIRPVGLELLLEAELGGVTVRGIIDRLEEDDDGELVVTDYKTGRTPMAHQEQSRLGGVHVYAALCEQTYGRIPAKVQLLYLGAEPQAIVATPTEQSVRATQRKLAAVWAAVERACEHEDFRPQRSALCSWCAFTEFCPAFGGDPSAATALAEQLRRTGTPGSGTAPAPRTDPAEAAFPVELLPRRAVSP